MVLRETYTDLTTTTEHVFGEQISLGPEGRQVGARHGPPAAARARSRGASWDRALTGEAALARTKRTRLTSTTPPTRFQRWSSLSRQDGPLAQREHGKSTATRESSRLVFRKGECATERVAHHPLVPCSQPPEARASSRVANAIGCAASGAVPAALRIAHTQPRETCSYVENPLNRGLHPASRSLPPVPSPLVSLRLPRPSLFPFCTTTRLLFLRHSSCAFCSRFTLPSLLPFLLRGCVFYYFFFFFFSFPPLLRFYLRFSETEISSIVWQVSFLRLPGRNLETTYRGRYWDAGGGIDHR